MATTQSPVAVFLDSIWSKFIAFVSPLLFEVKDELASSVPRNEDALFNYVSIIVLLSLAILGTLIWTVFDKERKNYNYLHEWLIILLRYYVIYQMLLYGLAKVFLMQFQEPDFTTLMQTYGDSPPMALLWTFMGYSDGYTIFTGLGEVAGAIFLLFRKTRTIGALTVFAVMINVMLLNFFYDVPVKLLASHLVLFSIIIILYDWKRLTNFFFLNHPTAALPLQPFFKNPKIEKWKEWVKIGSLAISIAGIFIVKIYLNKNAQERNANAELYMVETYKVNSEIDDEKIYKHQWKYLLFVDSKTATICDVLDNKEEFQYDWRIKERKLSFFNSDKNTFIDMKFSNPDSSKMILKGMIQKDTVEITLIKKRKSDFRLNQNRFNWINQNPDN